MGKYFSGGLNHAASSSAFKERECACVRGKGGGHIWEMPPYLHCELFEWIRGRGVVYTETSNMCLCVESTVQHSRRGHSVERGESGAGVCVRTLWISVSVLKASVRNGGQGCGHIPRSSLLMDQFHNSEDPYHPPPREGGGSFQWCTSGCNSHLL